MVVSVREPGHNFMESMEKNEKLEPLKTRILIVDDEIMLRDFLQEGLENFGFECSAASDGLEALEIMKRNPVEIVITDISMPHMDGIELTERIRDKYDSDVIVMTGLMEEYTYDKIMKIGASDFLAKTGQHSGNCSQVEACFQGAYEYKKSEPCREETA